jgi:hypothetical protein
MKHARSAVPPFLTCLLSPLLMLLLSPNVGLPAPEWTRGTQAIPVAYLDTANPGDSSETRNVSPRWYESVLRQQQIIAEQVDDLRYKLNQNLMTTEDFLDGVSSLFERTDRLYSQWKKLGPVEAKAISQPVSEAALVVRKDMAVGKSLNYLRLSLINFFLGYADSNGSQIADAEGQVALSKAWRTRSLLFIKALDS